MDRTEERNRGRTALSRRRAPATAICPGPPKYQGQSRGGEIGEEDWRRKGERPGKGGELRARQTVNVVLRGGQLPRLRVQYL